MARKRKPGRPRGSSQGPQLRRGKLSEARALAYLNRGLASALKKRGAGSKVGRKSRKTSGRGAPGRPKSAAHRKKIAAGVRAAHKRGAYRNRKRRGTRRRKAA